MDALRYQQDLISHLSGFVTANRAALFQQNIEQRTRYLTVVLEDIYQSQNASAVLRTCDCVGIQDVHIVEESNDYDVNPDVSLGSNQWLNMFFYREGKADPALRHNRRPGQEGGTNIVKAVNKLKKAGYRIVATSPHKDGASPENFSLGDGPAALLFGTELNGLTDQALELADEYIQIPMVGFTESYNISVSAALVLYTLRRRLESSTINWQIAEEERNIIVLDWLRSTIRMSRKLEVKFRQKYVNGF